MCAEDVPLVYMRVYGSYVTVRGVSVSAAMAAMLIGCASGHATRTVIVRGWSNPAGGNQPGAIREAVGVATDDCQAWLLNFGSFGGGRWEVHLRVTAARIDAVRQQLARIAGVASVDVRTSAAPPTGSGVLRTKCIIPPH